MYVSDSGTKFIDNGLVCSLLPIDASIRKRLPLVTGHDLRPIPPQWRCRNVRLRIILQICQICLPEVDDIRRIDLGFRCFDAPSLCGYK